MISINVRAGSSGVVAMRGPADEHEPRPQTADHFPGYRQLGSLARAAESLGIAQSTVTLHIQSLEAQFGAMLFTRLGRRAEMTEAGRLLADHAARLLQDAASPEEAMDEFGAGMTGHVRIGGQSPFSGRHFDLERPVCQPQPVSQPRLPIMIGGNGEQRTLWLVARYAEACNFLALDPDQVRAKLEVLKRHCDEAGRPFDEIERTSLNPITRRSSEISTSEIVRWLRALADAGIQHAIIDLRDAHELTPLEIIGREVIPEVTEMAAGR